MNPRKFLIIGVSTVMLLEGCAATPFGPSVAVMPAPNKPFQAFQDDTAVCKQFAEQQVAGQVDQVNRNAASAAILSTLLGAALGAAAGGGDGAGIGAAAGSLFGSAAGTDGVQLGQSSIQQQYDVAYSQCMYSKGNQVPGYQHAAYAAPPPPPPPSSRRPPPDAHN